MLTFKQSMWLKNYIDFNTQQLAGSSFLKDFFKLMNNSAFGKKQENLRKHVQVELITDVDILHEWVAKLNFCRGNPISDRLTVIQCMVAILTLNRPIYVGFSVPELSKLHMYNNQMHVKYPLFKVTDSLLFRQRISTEIRQRIQ